MEKKPCCVAEALRQVKQVQVDGKTVGIVWLEPVINEVAALNLSTEEQITAELMKRVKVYNYIPRNVEKPYASAVFEEYTKYIQRNRLQNTKKVEEPR